MVNWTYLNTTNGLGIIICEEEDYFASLDFHRDFQEVFRFCTERRVSDAVNNMTWELEFTYHC